jgi:hypothetical protein
MNISKEALQALYDVYNTWWNEIGTFEHPTENSKYCLLLLEDEQAMSDAAGKVEQHIPEIQDLLDIQV